MTTLDTKTDIDQLELEPLRVKGELVADQWWEAPPVKPVPFFKRHWLFLLTFCLPVAVAATYLFVVAADQYTSEAQFLVRTASHAEIGNLASLMQGQKLSRAIDESYAVAAYLSSRDVVSELVRDDHLRDILSRPQADIVNRFPNPFARTTDEALYRHFSNFVDLKIDSDSGVGIIRVRAFTPSDARDLTTALLAHGEALVNRLNVRAYEDAMRFAQVQVDESKGRLQDIETRLTQYRNDNKVIDPNKEAAAALTNVGALMSTLMGVEVALNQQVATTPTSPLIGPLREKAQAYRDQITQQREQIAGQNASLAGTMATYDGLMLDRELAERGLEASIAHLTNARQDAEQQQIYLQTIVSPNLSDMPLYPKRFLLMVLSIGVIGCVFLILRSMLRLLWEHQA